MGSNKPLKTERLVLRCWEDSDRETFTELNNDARVLEYLPGPLTRAQVDEWINRIDCHFEDYGFGLWAVEVPGEADFIGFVGLAVPRVELPFGPCVEVGWRIASRFWNRGFATEGARAAVAFGFTAGGLDEIVSFTVPANIRSRRVMEKLGMTHDPGDDFDHPSLEEGHRLRRHVLYRLSRSEWLENQPADS